jgi:hypothetical protein
VVRPGTVSTECREYEHFERSTASFTRDDDAGVRCRRSTSVYPCLLLCDEEVGCSMSACLEPSDGRGDCLVCATVRPLPMEVRPS